MQRWFEFLHEHDLQQEGEGMVLPSLEASISLHDILASREGSTLGLKVRVDLEDKSEKRSVLFPTPHSVSAKDTFKIIVVGLGLKCVWYSMSRG